MVFVRRDFFFLWVLWMGYVILLWDSLSLPYNYFKLSDIKQERISNCIHHICLSELCPSFHLNVRASRVGIG